MWKVIILLCPFVNEHVYAPLYATSYNAFGALYKKKGSILVLITYPMRQLLYPLPYLKIKIGAISES